MQIEIAWGSLKKNNIRPFGSGTNFKKNPKQKNTSVVSPKKSIPNPSNLDQVLNKDKRIFSTTLDWLLWEYRGLVRSSHDLQDKGAPQIVNLSVNM